MLEAYSLNIDVAANTAVPFKNVTIDKGCAEKLSGDSTIQLNDCGVYEVECNAVAGTSTTIQLYKNGVAQSQAQSTGTNVSFTTLVQVPTSNKCCPCSSPTIIQIMNTTEATFTNANIVVRKIA